MTEVWDSASSQPNWVAALRNALSSPAPASGQMIGWKIEETRSMNRLKMFPLGASSPPVDASSSPNLVIRPSSAYTVGTLSPMTTWY